MVPAVAVRAAVPAARAIIKLRRVEWVYRYARALDLVYFPLSLQGERKDREPAPQKKGESAVSVAMAIRR